MVDCYGEGRWRIRQRSPKSRTASLVIRCLAECGEETFAFQCEPSYNAPQPQNHSMEEMPTIDELRHELMVAMGAALLTLQFFELYVSDCLLYISPSKHYTSDDLLSGDATRRAPTLGVLLSALQRIMPLDPKFEDRLDVFIENRNFFIHRFFVPDLTRNRQATEADLYEKLSFILALIREANDLKPIFSGLYSLLYKTQVDQGSIQFDPDTARYATEMEAYERQFFSVLRGNED